LFKQIIWHHTTRSSYDVVENSGKWSCKSYVRKFSQNVTGKKKQVYSRNLGSPLLRTSIQKYILSVSTILVAGKGSSAPVICDYAPLDSTTERFKNHTQDIKLSVICDNVMDCDYACNCRHKERNSEYFIPTLGTLRVQLHNNVVRSDLVSNFTTVTVGDSLSLLIRQFREGNVSTFRLCHQLPCSSVLSAGSVNKLTELPLVHHHHM